jgi:hypothetical protein
MRSQIKFDAILVSLTVINCSNNVPGMGLERKDFCTTVLRHKTMIFRCPCQPVIGSGRLFRPESGPIPTACRRVVRLQPEGRPGRPDLITDFYYVCLPPTDVTFAHSHTLVNSPPKGKQAHRTSLAQLKVT